VLRRQNSQTLARLYAAATRRAEEMSILHRISMATASTLELEPLLALIYEQIGRILDVTTFYIALFDKETRQLRFEFIMDNGVREPNFVRSLDGESGLTGYIARTRQPLLIRDLVHQEPFLPVPALRGGTGEEPRSYLGVPLVLQDRLVGVLSVQSYEPNVYDEEHQNLLMAVATPVALAIENARLFAERERRIRELTTFGEVTRALVSSLSLEEILTKVIRLVSDLMQVEAGSVLLLEGDELVFKVALGEKGEAVKPIRLRLGQGIAGWVALHGQSVLVSDVASDPRHFRQADLATEFTTRSILCAPMRYQDQIIGAIELLNRVDGQPFTQDDLALLEPIANAAAIATRNAQLYEEISQRLAEVSTLYTLAQRISTLVDLQAILDSVVEIIRQVLHCRGCCIFLLDEARQVLEIKAASGLAPYWVREARLKVGEGIAGKAVQEGRSIYVPDSRLESEFIIFDERVRSLMVVPLVVKEKIIGALCIDDDKPNAFDSNEGRWLSIAAAQVAAAIENARLYQDLQRRAISLEQAYTKAKELDRRRTELIQDVSHELRTPLSYVKAYVDLLLDGSSGELTREQQASLEIVQQKTDAIIRMVEDILFLQRDRPEDIDRAPVDLGSIATVSVQAAEVASQRAGVILSADIPRGLPLVLGDSRRLGQVFDNLIQNAIKFTPAGRHVHVALRQEGAQILSAVADEGVGIPADKQRFIFERFYQVESLRRRHSGMGLGLTICKHIVELHGGHIWVESEEGKGSTFYFTIPLAPEGLAQDPTSLSAP